MEGGGDSRTIPGKDDIFFSSAGLQSTRQFRHRFISSLTFQDFVLSYSHDMQNTADEPVESDNTLIHVRKVDFRPVAVGF